MCLSLRALSQHGRVSFGARCLAALGVIGDLGLIFGIIDELVQFRFAIIYRLRELWGARGGLRIGSHCALHQTVVCNAFFADCSKVTEVARLLVCAGSWKLVVEQRLNSRTRMAHILAPRRVDVTDAVDTFADLSDLFISARSGNAIVGICETCGLGYASRLGIPKSTC